MRYWWIVASMGLASCDATSSARPAALHLQLDTAALIVGDTLRLRPMVTDADGVEIHVPVSWESLDTAWASVDEGLVVARRPGFSPGGSGPFGARIVARAGAASDTAYVVPEYAAVSGQFLFGVKTMSPGASFIVRAPFVLAGLAGGFEGYIGATYPAAKGTGALTTSDSSVVSWDAAVADGVNPGWRLTARATGVAEIVARYGGAMARMTVTVRDAPAISAPGGTLSGANCAIGPDGTVWCAGGNATGQLGTRTAPFHQPCCTRYQQMAAAPVAIDTDLRFTRLADHCAIATTRRLYCWGSDRTGGSLPSSTDCYYYNYPGSPLVNPPCTFVPLAVDRDLGQVLLFDDLQSQGSGTCGHVVGRGPSLSETAAVSEYWCWGGNYPDVPTQRPGMHQ
jgi:hypothetical protein